jgi:hypothetical protein
VNRLVLIMLTMFLILPALGCETIKTGKDIAIDNPMSESKKLHSLSDARQEVERTRYELDQCKKANSGDATRCQSQQTAYDKSVAEYVSLQTQ